MATRMDNLDMHVAALDGQISKYHGDVLRKGGNQSPTKPRWRPWFPLRTTDDLSAMEHNLQNENCRADVVRWHLISLRLLGGLCSKDANREYKRKNKVLPQENVIRRPCKTTIMAKNAQ